MAIVAISGCETLPPPPQDDRTTEQQIADGLALFGVDATQVFAGASALVNAILAANQVLLGRDRKKAGNALRGIDVAEGSPTVATMLESAITTGTVSRKDAMALKKLLDAG